MEIQVIALLFIHAAACSLVSLARQVDEAFAPVVTDGVDVGDFGALMPDGKIVVAEDENWTSRFLTDGQLRPSDITRGSGPHSIVGAEYCTNVVRSENGDIH